MSNVTPVRTPASGTPKVLQLDQALRAMVHLKGSDLHLTVDAPPTVRKDGELQSIAPVSMTEDMLKPALMNILSEDQRIEFAKDDELDFSYELTSEPYQGERFRVNYFIQKGHMAAAFRHISTEIRSLEELHMPAQVARLADLPRGLVLVTGPTGSGKLSTNATLVQIPKVLRRHSSTP